MALFRERERQNESPLDMLQPNFKKKTTKNPQLNYAITVMWF